MTMNSVVRLKPHRKSRSAAKHRGLETRTTSTQSPAATKPLTLAQAAILAKKAPPLSTLSPNCRHTTLVDNSVLSKYEQVTKSRKVTGKGAILFLQSIIAQQRHLKDNMESIKSSCVSLGNGFRKGLFRVMTLKSFRQSHVSVIKRIYRKQNPNQQVFTGDVLLDIERIITDAKTFLSPSREMKAIGVEETSLLIASMGQGKHTFYSEASLMTAVLECARRISCFKNRLFSHIVSIRNITDPTRAEDKSAFLLELTFKRYADKGEGEGEDDHNEVVLRGSIYSNGFIDSVYFQNRRCLEQFGVALYDPETGMSILDHMRTNPDLSFILAERLFEVNVDSMYLVYRRAQENTNVTAHPMRPHGVRKFMYSKGIEALESGEIASPNLAALRSQMAHSPYSRSGRTFYLGSQYTQSLNFAALFHPNQEIRRLGIRVSSGSMQQKWSMTEPPRTLWNPMNENLDVVEDMVASRLGREDAKKEQNSVLPKFYERPSRVRVLRKLSKLLRRFGRKHSSQSKMSKEAEEKCGREMLVNTLSSGFNRDEMIQYVEKKVFLFW